MRYIIVVVMVCMVALTTQAKAGDRRTWKDVHNKQTDYNHGRQWVVIKETYCMVHKYTGEALYSTRYYVYDDERAQHELNEFRPSSNRHDGITFIVAMEAKGYFTNRHGANVHMNRLRQSDKDYNRRLR